MMPALPPKHTLRPHGLPGARNTAQTCSWARSDRTAIKIFGIGGRNGAIVFSDLTGKLDVLRVGCDKCGRAGCDRLNRLAEDRGHDG
jgi:hypothetical protein